MDLPSGAPEVRVGVPEVRVGAPEVRVGAPEVRVGAVMWTYRARLVNVVDGDTVDLAIDLGFNITDHVRVRIDVIDTAELNSKDPIERALAQTAKDRVTGLLTDRELLITTRKGDAKDGFGRYLATIVLPDGSDVGQLLMQEGLAVPYHR